MFALLVLGSLSVVAVTGGVVAYKVVGSVEQTKKTKEKIEDSITGPYTASLNLFNEIITDKVKFHLELEESKKSGFDEFSARNKFCVMYISETSEGFYYVELKKESQKILNLQLDKDGILTNINYEDSLSLGSDMKEYVIKLKESLNVFLSVIKDKKQKEAEAKLAFDNINSITTNTKLTSIPNIEKIENLLNEYYFGDAEVFKKSNDALNLARSLFNLEKFLSIENLNDLNKITEERFYNLLYHYANLTDVDKEKNREELLLAIENIGKTLNNIIEQCKKINGREFEKQLILINENNN